MIGALAGRLSLALFGLTTAPAATASGVEWPRVGAAALSLGVMPHLWQIQVLMGAIVILVAQAFVINRLAGTLYPLCAPPQETWPILFRFRIPLSPRLFAQ